MTRVETQWRCYDCEAMGFLKGDWIGKVEYCPVCGGDKMRVNPVSDNPETLERLRSKHGYE